MTGQCRALSLWQPWASLVSMGVKSIETRSWATKYRGPLIICSTQRPPAVPGLGGWIGRYLLGAWTEDLVHADPCDCNLDEEEVGERCMKRSGGRPALLEDGGAFAPSFVSYLPLGAALATCRVVDCVPTIHIVFGDEADPGEHYLDNEEDGAPVYVVHPSEEALGDFTPGRYAWLLADIEPLPAPIPVRGRQGLWSSRELDLAIDAATGMPNVCRYCFAPILWAEGLFCSDAHKAAFGRPARGNSGEILDEFRVDGPVTDGEQMELA